MDSFVPTGKNDVHVRMLQMDSLLFLYAELIPIWPLLFSFFYGTVFAIGCIYRKRVLSFSIATTVEVNNNCLLAKYSLFLNGERELGNSEPTLLHRTEQ